MALHDRIQQLREKLTSQGQAAVPDAFQGVTKNRIEEVLRKIDRSTSDLVDVVFALLDDQQPSWFTNAPEDAKFCDGASTAQIGCHVGILQRNKGKLDREGRDYWLKPLWELGAIEKVYLDSNRKLFIHGHPVAKSSNCAYRLAKGFVLILRATGDRWQQMLDDWVSEDAVRERLRLQAELAEQSRKAVDTKHSGLIRACREHYAPRFLPGYELLYVDEADGDRITSDDRQRLARAGIELLLSDAMPDLLYWDAASDRLWVIEAVTSDGEVDLHKKRQFEELAERCGKSGVGFTTAYPSWKVAAARQGRVKNIPPGTFIWIQEDPSKQLEVKPSGT